MAWSLAREDRSQDLVGPNQLSALRGVAFRVQPPPRPELVGSRKPRQALAAMAASTAEPPHFNISIAVRVATGCAVPAAPEHPIAEDQVAKLAPEIRSPVCTSGRVNRSAPAGWNFGSCGSASGGCNEGPFCWKAAASRGRESVPAAASGRLGNERATTQWILLKNITVTVRIPVTAGS